MSQAQTRTVEMYGHEVDVTPVRELSGGQTRLELDENGGPRWRIDVTSTGGDYEVVTAWNERDDLADVDVPDWVEDLIARLQRV